MSGIDHHVSKKKRKRLWERRLIKSSCSHYFNVEVASNENVTRVTYNICALYLPQIQVEARET